MKKTLSKVGISLLVLLGGSSVPLIPSNLELQYSYQYPVANYQVMVTDPDTKTTYENPQPNFTDDNADGLISVAVFKDNSGNTVYQQIDEDVYSDMGRVNGHSRNPKKTDLMSILEIVTPRVEAAIALDSANAGASGTGTSLTYAHTTSGSDRILFVGFAVTTQNTDDITGVTYNGSALTLVDKIKVPDTDNRWVYLYYIVAPSTGANNIVINSTSSTAKTANAVSYTGASQTGVPDSSATNTATSGTTFALTTTSVADNSWLVAMLRVGSTGLVAGANTTLRGTVSSFSKMADSNAAVTPAGSNSLNFTTDGNSPLYGGVVASFAPSVVILNVPSTVIRGRTIIQGRTLVR